MSKLIFKIALKKNVLKKSKNLQEQIPQKQIQANNQKPIKTNENSNKAI